MNLIIKYIDIIIAHDITYFILPTDFTYNITCNRIELIDVRSWWSVNNSNYDIFPHIKLTVVYFNKDRFYMVIEHPRVLSFNKLYWFLT